MPTTSVVQSVSHLESNAAERSTSEVWSRRGMDNVIRTTRRGAAQYRQWITAVTLIERTTRLLERRSTNHLTGGDLRSLVVSTI
jgi:hypothetical protein